MCVPGCHPLVREGRDGARCGWKEERGASQNEQRNDGKGRPPDLASLSFSSFQRRRRPCTRPPPGSRARLDGFLCSLIYPVPSRAPAKGGHTPVRRRARPAPLHSRRPAARRPAQPTQRGGSLRPHAERQERAGPRTRERGGDREGAAAAAAVGGVPGFHLHPPPVLRLACSVARPVAARPRPELRDARARLVRTPSHARTLFTPAWPEGTRSPRPLRARVRGL